MTEFEICVTVQKYMMSIIIFLNIERKKFIHVEFFEKTQHTKIPWSF